MKGSVISKFSGDTTDAARCPGPTKPGAAGGTFTTRLIPRRCDMFPPSVIDLSGSFGNRLLNGRFAPFKQSRTAADETGEQGCYTPEGSTALKPGKSIDRERSWPSECKTQCGRGEHEGVLVATILNKKTLA